jgi:hypothetical protein
MNVFDKSAHSAGVVSPENRALIYEIFVKIQPVIGINHKYFVNNS